MYLALRFFCVVFHFAMYLAYDLGFHIILCSSVFSGLVVDTCLPTAGHGEGWPRDGRLRPADGGDAWHPGDVGRRRPTTEDGDRGEDGRRRIGMEVRSFYGFAYVYILRNYLFRDFRHFGDAVVW